MESTSLISPALRTMFGMAYKFSDVLLVTSLAAHRYLIFYPTVGNQ
jgi:hypothetical protein